MYEAPGLHGADLSLRRRHQYHAEAASKGQFWASIMAPATLYSWPSRRLVAVTERCKVDLRTDASYRGKHRPGLLPEKRSAAVVPSERLSKKLCTAVRLPRLGLSRCCPQS